MCVHNTGNNHQQAKGRLILASTSSFPVSKEGDSMSTVYFCWVCDGPALPGLVAAHYEDGRKLYFCSEAHHNEYRQLASL
jgi:hypothetical protein